MREPPARVRLAAKLEALGSEKYASWLLSLFLVCGPIYWLPGISRDAFKLAEWSLLVVTIGLVSAPQLLRGTRPFPGGLLGPLGFLGLVALSLPGLVQASTLSVSVEFVVKTALSAAFLWTFFSLAKDKNDVFIIFQRAFFILSALVLILLVMLIWDTTVGDAHLWGSISVEGLGYSRYIVGLGLRPAGWSLGTALFVPIAALVFLSRPAQWRWDRKIFSVAAVMVLVASQIVSGGRIGILLSVLAIAGFAFLPSTRRLAAILLLVCLLPYSIVCLNTCCKLHLHLDRIPGVGIWLFEGNQVDDCETREAFPFYFYYYDNEEALDMGELLIESIDYLSTRRFQGYMIGLKRLWERPFLGHGLHQVKLYLPYRPPVEIHNLWLKWGVYSGVLAPLLFLAMVASILRAGWRIYRDGTRTEEERDMSGALGLIIIAGLVVSQLEINIPLGAFQLSAVWWAAAGSLVGIAQSRHPTS